ncbi:hypothetical protein RD792_000024 [Penstemon davidsonii]|uniref:Dynamin-related protein 4C-like n=1 Tax=Penstemon davidsonii TaxID=160366 RepID=A0ABR0DWW8_9LAMI|nr:hypothetical protein RD792_000024 [Penstemon davidsonii]
MAAQISSSNRNSLSKYSSSSSAAVEDPIVKMLRLQMTHTNEEEDQAVYSYTDDDKEDQADEEEDQAVYSYSDDEEEEEDQAVSSYTDDEEEDQATTRAGAPIVSSYTDDEEEEDQAVSSYTDDEEEEDQAVSSYTDDEEEEEEDQAVSSYTDDEEEEKEDQATTPAGAPIVSSYTDDEEEEEEDQAVSSYTDEEEDQATTPAGAHIVSSYTDDEEEEEEDQAVSSYTDDEEEEKEDQATTPAGAPIVSSYTDDEEEEEEDQAVSSYTDEEEDQATTPAGAHIVSSYTDDEEEEEEDQAISSYTDDEEKDQATTPAGAPIVSSYTDDDEEEEDQAVSSYTDDEEENQATTPAGEPIVSSYTDDEEEEEDQAVSSYTDDEEEDQATTPAGAPIVSFYTDDEEEDQAVSSYTDDDEEDQATTLAGAPIVSPYNDRIRPLLDAIEKLRHLKIMQEGIQLPTIVVVGDQSSGKSSVLESLAGISLPRGQGICTRVPLIMRLQNNSDPKPAFFLKFNRKTIPIKEEEISEAISFATEYVAGKGRGISNTPLTLVVKKKGVPDLTMVDLPGITRVAILDQPEDIYEQIFKMNMEYITPENSIILNVISAGVDFTTCESIRMSQHVDKTGERTLVVVTKADKSPEGLLEKVTADDVNIGLGYVCVRNRIGDESYKEARDEETRLFERHHLLSRISKSMVGIPVLAERLVKIQAAIIVKCLPDIFKKINEKLSTNVEDLNKLPKHISSIAEAMTTFMHVLGFAKESLKKILLQGEFNEYPNETAMHCTARLAEMINKYFVDLQSNGSDHQTDKFLLEEIKVLEETKSVGLPNFLPKTTFVTLLRKKVKDISMIPFDFIKNVWNYIENIVVAVLIKHSDNYPQLLSSTKRAASNLIAKKKQQSVNWVNDIIEMEKLTDYTCNPDYTTSWNKLISCENEFMNTVNNQPPRVTWKINIEGLGLIDIAHLRGGKGLLHEAFDVKMRITAYWNIVLRRMVDCMALHLAYSVEKLVNGEMEMEVINEVMGHQGNGLERMLGESPSVADKRQRLKNSIELLKEAKDVLANIIDRVVTNSY